MVYSSPIFCRRIRSFTIKCDRRKKAKKRLPFTFTWPSWVWTRLTRIRWWVRLRYSLIGATGCFWIIRSSSEERREAHFGPLLATIFTKFGISDWNVVTGGKMYQILGIPRRIGGRDFELPGRIQNLFRREEYCTSFLPHQIFSSSKDILSTRNILGHSSDIQSPANYTLRTF